MGKQWEADRKVPGLGLMTLPSGVQTWYLRFREPGGRQQTHKIGRAEIVNRTMAREEAHKLLADVARGNVPTKVRRLPTMADLHQRMQAEHYGRLRERTSREYDRLWRVLVLPAMGAMKVEQVERRDVIGLLAPLSPVSANRALQMLKAAFNKAELWQLRPDHSNPCRRIPKQPEPLRERYLTREETVQLLAALDAFPLTPLRWRFVQLIRLLLLTGCRVGEIVRGRWEWFQEETAVLLIPSAHHKTGNDGKMRKVHLAPAAVAILRELQTQAKTPWIIAGHGDHHLIGYQKLWEELLRNTEIINLRIHDLRHNFASVGISQAGLTLTEVGKLLGHASPVTTQRYAHLADEAAAAAASKVAAFIA